MDAEGQFVPATVQERLNSLPTEQTPNWVTQGVGPPRTQGQGGLRAIQVKRELGGREEGRRREGERMRQGRGGEGEERGGEEEAGEGRGETRRQGRGGETGKKQLYHICLGNNTSTEKSTDLTESDIAL